MRGLCCRREASLRGVISGHDSKGWREREEKQVGMRFSKGGSAAKAACVFLPCEMPLGHAINSPFHGQKRIEGGGGGEGGEIIFIFD